MGPNGPRKITDLEYAQNYGDPVPEEPEPGDIGSRVLGYFWKLSRHRRPGFDGPAPLTYSDVGFWSQLSRTFISPHEVELIMRADEAYITAVSENRERRDRIEKSRSEAQAKARKMVGGR